MEQTNAMASKVEKWENLTVCVLKFYKSILFHEIIAIIKLTSQSKQIELHNVFLSALWNLNLCIYLSLICSILIAKWISFHLNVLSKIECYLLSLMWNIHSWNYITSIIHVYCETSLNTIFHTIKSRMTLLSDRGWMSN